MRKIKLFFSIESKGIKFDLNAEICDIFILNPFLAKNDSKDNNKFEIRKQISG